LARETALSAQEAQSAQSAPFIFFGTVLRPGGANVEALDREEEPSAVVRVDELVIAPPVVGDIKDQEVTIRLTGSPVRRGQRLLWMASSLVYGAELGLMELARVAPGRQTTRMLEEVLQAKLRQDDNEVLSRLGQAEVVVYGRAESIETFVPASPLPALGEAALSWRIADLLVWRILKGRPTDHPRVVFPFPRTHKWSEAPLFIPGQEGIWLLHPLETGKSARSPQPPAVTNGYQAPDDLDFYAPSSFSRIHLLLQMLLAQERSR
jgi:hypothetical protein